MTDCNVTGSTKRHLTSEAKEGDCKREKLENENEDNCKENVKVDFKGTSIVTVLNEKVSQKAIFLHGKFEEDNEKDALIILERKPFDLSAAALAKLLSSQTKLKVDLKNDIYGTYKAIPPPELCDIKATVIYPATQKHLDKYKKQNVYCVTETAEDYENITKPYLEKQFESKVFNIQWVYNILEHKKESERILFEDTDPQTGFILLPDMKWDGKDKNSLYVVAIPHRRGIKSLRDLTEEHLPLLKNIETKSAVAISDKFGISVDRLRFYFHYQPSYFHLHVHINHIELDIPGTGAVRAHLLCDVIQNLELTGDYYKKKIFSFTLTESDKLLAALKKV